MALQGSASLLALSVFMCDGKRGFGGHLDFNNFEISCLSQSIMGLNKSARLADNTNS